MRKRTFVTLSLCGMLCVAVSAQAAPLTNFDTSHGSVDLGMWHTDASISGLIKGYTFDDFSAAWRPYGGITYGIGEHWGLRYAYHGMASDRDIINLDTIHRIRLDYRGTTNELNLLYSFKKDSRVALFVGANRVKNELRINASWCGKGAWEGTRTHFQGGLVATAPLSHKVDAYGLAGFGTHGLFQGELGLAYKVKDNWQANIGYRWFRLKDCFDELNTPCGQHEDIDSAGTLKVKGMTFGVTYFFGPGG